MRIAFYAPLRAPADPTPSGEGAMARGLIAALTRAGHTVALALRLRSRDGAGDAGRQRRIADIGGALARRYLRRVRGARIERPDLWFTYHVYHKAPDWIGPAVSAALGIPYVVAEASVAAKRGDGPWAIGHAGAGAAIRRADAVVSFNDRDIAGLLGAGVPRARIHALRPFTDLAPFLAAERAVRGDVMRRFDLDPAAPLLLTVAMMRAGDKAASYAVLAAALARIAARPWQLLVVGDGPARPAIEARFAPFAARVRYAGTLPRAALAELYAASDLLVWPAVREAYGLVLLEAAAAGLAVVAGDSGGVPGIVRDRRTGLLAPEGDADAFAAAVAELLDDPARRAAMGATARATAAREHGLDTAARRLDSVLASVVRMAA